MGSGLSVHSVQRSMSYRSSQEEGRVHIQGLRNVINNGDEGVRNIIGGDHSQHHESSNQGMEEGVFLVACGGICGDSFIVRFVAKVVDIP